MNQPASEALARPTHELTCHAVQAALGAAVHFARGQGLAINVAVVDRSGVLLGLLRMPGAFLHSMDIAIDKAYTAAGFGLPTEAWHAALQSHSPAVRQGLVGRPRFAGFGGGLPMLVEGERVGGIGVSGGSEAQDEACAGAALQSLGLAEGASSSHDIVSTRNSPCATSST